MTVRDAFSAWKLELLDWREFLRLPGSVPGKLGRSALEYLLQFSVLAPSTHNSVPQVYEVDVPRQRVRLHLRRRHVLPASDPTGREALISVGCAVENLTLAAHAYGVAASWTTAPDLRWEMVTHTQSDFRVYLGEVVLESSTAPSGDVTPHEALRPLCDRKVVRAEFDAALRMPRDLIHDLEADAGPSPAARLHLFESDREKFAWGKLDELATKHKLEQPQFRAELGHCLLPDDDTTSSRGMRGREFGLDASAAAQLAAQLRGELPMAVDQLAFMARAARAGLTSSSAVCAISCLDHGPAGSIEAGRLFQRTTLRAFRAGFANAVHTAICEVPHARKMCEATLLGGRTPAVVFRLGRPLHEQDWHRPHSSRPSLEELMHA